MRLDQGALNSESAWSNYVSLVEDLTRIGEGIPHLFVETVEQHATERLVAETDDEVTRLYSHRISCCKKPHRELQRLFMRTGQVEAAMRNFLIDFIVKDAKRLRKDNKKNS